MNYYEHHLGDYLRDTAHLSMIEDGAYRRLLDLYYTREDILPPNLDAICRLIRARAEEEKAAVIVVLDEFFTRTDDGYRHKRCDEEVARYHEKQEKARSSANARWSRSERIAVAMPTHSEGNALQTPDSRHQSPDIGRAPAKRASALPPEFELTEIRREYATSKLPNVDPTEMFAAFRDHHSAKGTTAKDWDASWRTYVRNGLKFGYPMVVKAQQPPQKIVRYDSRGRVIEP
jgi:uncharacterized protein YdaU (DUF1376 family)